MKSVITIYARNHSYWAAVSCISTFGESPIRGIKNVYVCGSIYLYVNDMLTNFWKYALVLCILRLHVRHEDKCCCWCCCCCTCCCCCCCCCCWSSCLTLSLERNLSNRRCECLCVLFQILTHFSHFVFLFVCLFVCLFSSNKSSCVRRRHCQLISSLISGRPYLRY